MNKTGLVLTLTAICLAVMVCSTGSVDAASESTEVTFPSMSEIFSTLELPDYSFQTFLDDAKTVFSADMIEQMGTYLGHLIGFITEDTFLADIGSIDSETFTGNNGYVNIFVLLCVIIASICILGALITYFANRKTFRNARKQI